MPWMDANGISIHFKLGGQGPSVVLLHEMGGTLDSWDGIFPALSERFRTLRYDQRGSGFSEKVRQPITMEILEEDLEAVLQESGLSPPYHFVTVAAATMQVLIYMTKHPDRVASFVFCNPFTGADPSRVAALEQRADLAEREGLRKAIPTTLDKSWPPDIGAGERVANAKLATQWQLGHVDQHLHGGGRERDEMIGRRGQATFLQHRLKYLLRIPVVIGWRTFRKVDRAGRDSAA